MNSCSVGSGVGVRVLLYVKERGNIVRYSCMIRRGIGVLLFVREQYT